MRTFICTRNLIPESKPVVVPVDPRTGVTATHSWAVEDSPLPHDIIEVQCPDHDGLPNNERML